MSSAEAEVILADLAAVFFSNSLQQLSDPFAQKSDRPPSSSAEEHLPDVNEVYRALVENNPKLLIETDLRRGG